MILVIGPAVRPLAGYLSMDSIADFRHLRSPARPSGPRILYERRQPPNQFNIGEVPSHIVGAGRAGQPDPHRMVRRPRLGAFFGSPAPVRAARQSAGAQFRQPGAAMACGPPDRPDAESNRVASRSCAATLSRLHAGLWSRSGPDRIPPARDNSPAGL